MWRWSILKTGHLCLVISRFQLYFVGFKKDTVNGKVACQGCQVQVCCYHICRRNRSHSLRQNVSNLCQSIFVFLTVYCDKIFKHWLESSSLIRLRFSSFTTFVHKQTQVKLLKDEVNVQVLRVARRLLTFFKPFYRDRGLELWNICFKILVRIASDGPQIDQSHGENRLSHIIISMIIQAQFHPHKSFNGGKAT